MSDVDQLEAHRDELADVHLRTLFSEDPGRGERLTGEGAGLYLDYRFRAVAVVAAVGELTVGWDELRGHERCPGPGSASPCGAAQPEAES